MNTRFAEQVRQERMAGSDPASRTIDSDSASMSRSGLLTAPIL